MKKIGIIANTSWNILNFRLGLIKALQKEGHEVVIMAPYDEHSEELHRLGFKVNYVKGLSRKGTNPIKDIFLILELARLYKRLELDLVLQYTIKPNIYGSLAGFLVRKKTVSTVTGLGYIFLNEGLSSKIGKILYRIAFKFSHLVFFQNSDDKALFEELGLVSKDKSRLIHGSGIDTNEYHPNYCSEIPKDHSKTTFLMIARLLKDKGVYEFVEAAKRMKSKYEDVEFLLLGDQDLGNPAAVSEQDILQWKKENIIQILGFKKNTKDYICQSDVVVLPSYREGIPRVILESFSMGKPSITTDAPGCKHTVDHMKNGLICKVADADDLYHKMEMFYMMPKDQKERFGVAARSKSLEVYSIDIIVNHYLNIVESV